MIHLFTLLFLAFIATSCEMNGGELDKKNNGLTFAEGTELLAEFKARGGSATFKFTADLDWEATASEEWITVSPDKGEAGEGQIKIKAKENEELEEREGYVDITLSNDKSYRIEVEQMEGDPICELGDDGEYIVSAKGGEVEIEVTTNIEYSIYIPTSARKWISHEDTRALRTDIVILDISKNTGEKRSATIKLRDKRGETLQEITIEQKGVVSSEEEKPVFEIGDNGEYIVEATGGDVEIEVTTNLEYSVYIPKDVRSWVEFIETRSVRNETVVLSVAVNDSETERTAIIELRDKSGDTLEEITIVQRGKSAEDEEPVFEIGDNGEYIVEATGGDVEIEVTTNLEYSVYIPKDVEEWVELIETRSVRNETVVLSVAVNDSEAERTAIIELRDKSGDTLEEITIVQRGKSAEDEEPSSEVPNNEIWYTTTDGMEFKPYDVTGFGANLIDNTYIDGKGVLLFDGDVTTIGESAFSSCNSLTSITIPDSVTTIGNYAFFWCSSLTSITIPDSVTEIGSWAFEYCSSLESVTIGDSVTTIGYYAFHACSSLTEFKGKFASEDGRCLIIDGTLNSFAPAGVTEYTIPDSVTTIGYVAFYECSSLTSITIPDSVTAIGESVFYECSSLTEFKGKFASEDGRCLIIDGTLNSFAPAGVTEYTIPDSVTTIGRWAFAYCRSLTSITIPNSVTTIGWGAFDGCISLTSITIPDSVTAIGDFAFCGCRSLTSITIPDSVTTIGDHAFAGCSSLTSVTIGNSVTTIGAYAFSDCSSLTSVTIGNSVTEIGYEAFYKCSSLESVYCKPTTPPSIGDGVFDGNASGRKIYVPAESVAAYQTAEGWSDYADSIVGYNFESGDVPNNEIWYTTTDGMALDPYNTTDFGANLIDNTYVDGKGVLLFDGDVTTIGESAFEGCSSLTSITIPDSVTTIGEDAFAHCDSLTSITIPDNVTEIGDYAFNSCTNLSSLDLGNGVESIGFAAFAYCYNLVSVTIPDSVTTIGGSAFNGCISLTEFKGKFASEDGRCLIIDGTLNSFAPAGVTEYTIPDSVTEIGYGAFYGCSRLTSITIPDNVTTIGEAAFHSCSSLTSITIPDSVTEIGKTAFYECSSLQSVTIGNSVTAIGRSAFYKCSSLTSITIPDSITTIGDFAFQYCSSLTSVTIPNSVTTIGDFAFDDCSSLKSVYCKPTTPPSIGNWVFDNNASGRKIYVPAESVAAYQTSEGWSDYADSIVGYNFETGEVIEPTIPDNEIWYTTTDGMALDLYNTTGFGANLIDNTYIDGMGVLLFDGDVTTIGEAAFYDCSSLTSVTIPDSVTKIGDSAFEYCSSLTSVTIPDSVTKIGDSAFEYCSSLTSITIPDSVTEIGKYAFEYCDSLTSITIPDSVTTIGEYAFGDCRSLTEFKGKFASEDGRCLIIDGMLNSFAPAGVTEYTIPDSVTEIGEYAFEYCDSLTSITIPDSVTTIGEEAFSGCDSLTSVTIPDSVTEIGDWAFRYCSSLTSITIPDSVTTIGECAFQECSSLTEFKGKFASEDGRCLIIDGTLNSFAPAGVTEYTIPDSVTAIGDGVFSGCSNLTSITIPDSVTTIGWGAFYGCSSLTSITIPDSVTAIGDYAFSDCSSLTSVTIGNSVTEIGRSAFEDCSSLKSVYCKPTTPPSIGNDVFYNNASGRKIYVPAESVEAYKTAYYWSNYASSIVGYEF